MKLQNYQILSVTIQTIITAEKLKITYFKVSWILGGRWDKLVSSRPGSRKDNHATAYCIASNPSVSITFSYNRKSQERFLFTAAPCLGTTSSSKSSQHSHTSNLWQKHLLQRYALHCVENESKWWKKLQKTEAQMPIPSVQSRNHSNLMDSCVPQHWNKQWADA